MTASTSAANGKVEGFLKDLADQLRAGDTYGKLDKFSDEAMLAPFVLTKEQRRQISVACDIDAVIEARVRSFYQAVAAAVEKATRVETTTVLDLNHEGFGRVVIFAGRLVVLSDVLRDAQRFGFNSLEDLAARGEAFVTAAAKYVDQYREAARDDS
ncbi:probable nitrogen fixation protein [Parafrankia irregularis]|uniref:Probable nitrogen fixation protein n=1 Tax=Parafrankia irregularis TaxID=795642 RepID=A0A0S4QL54_9ACTN|nr:MULTISPECIES: NifX-associated nitrogen fixation protein [Parafrankia]MBE3203887.1 NifX-associated nitrogen fixation protein [Parafrankia sp. CH37]CUU55242.1 probable nitrogen fixation protein [Parafrankia irregularis]